MKVYCHTSVTINVDGGRCYVAGEYYNLDPNEDFDSIKKKKLNPIFNIIDDDYRVFVFTGIIDKKLKKSQGCRFAINRKVGACEIFSNYFYNDKELRMMKLKKLNYV